jgi:hypothetical protein
MPDPGDTAQGMETLRRALEDLAPSGLGATIQTVDLQGGSLKAMTLREAKAFLDRAHKDGLRIWMVVSPVDHD